MIWIQKGTSANVSRHEMSQVEVYLSITPLPDSLNHDLCQLRIGIRFC